MKPLCIKGHLMKDSTYQPIDCHFYDEPETVAVKNSCNINDIS